MVAWAVGVVQGQSGASRWRPLAWILSGKYLQCVMERVVCVVGVMVCDMSWPGTRVVAEVLLHLPRHDQYIEHHRFPHSP